MIKMRYVTVTHIMNIAEYCNEWKTLENQMMNVYNLN